MRLAAAWMLLLASSTAWADVTVEVQSYSATFGELVLTVSGDAVDVRLDAQGGKVFDWIAVGGEGGTAIPTVPAIGSNNDGTTSTFVTVRGPFTAVVDLDPVNSQPYPGIKASVDGVQKDLHVGVAVVFGSVPDPPPPPTITGEATLTWEWPTENTDETPLTDLVGGRVWWSTNPLDWPLAWSAAVGLVTTYTVTGLPPGSWNFTVTAINSQGIESERSDIATKLIPDVPPPPDPVDCVVDDPPWVLGVPQPTVCPVSGMQTRTDIRLLSILTPPVNGGMECPPLNETRTVDVTCTPPVVPTVFPEVSGLSHAVVFGVSALGARQAAVLGYVPIGTPCIGPVVYTYRTIPYRLVPNPSVLWAVGVSAKDRLRNNIAAACR